MGVNALVGTLGNYGGPTQTIPLLPGSPAIDAGSVVLAVDANDIPLTTDQRGAGFPRVINEAVDIGAFESSFIQQTISFGQLAGQTYGAPTMTLNATDTSDLPLSYAVISGPATISGSVLTITGAGNVEVQASQAGDSTYNMATPVDESFTVTPAQLTITANNATKTYGTQTTFSSTAFTETGLVNSDTITSVTETSAGAAASAQMAGSPYAIDPSTATGNGLSNYTIGYVNGNLTVNPATLTITANNDSKTYGTLKTFSSMAFTESGLVNSDTITSVTETSNGAGLAATVGTYPIIASAATGTGLSNYAIGYVNGTLTVNAAALTITANNDSKTYGTLKTFGGTAFTESGLVNSDTITSVTETSNGAGLTATVGTYPITSSAATGTGLSNYAIGYVNGTLTVNAAALTITANNDSKTYGTLKTFSSTAYTESGLVNSDAITGLDLASTGAVSSATVGTYAIVPSTATGTGLSNYAIGYVNGNLTVNPATLTITANDDSKTYGILKTFINSAFTESGLVNSDAITGLDLASTGAVSSATVGTYPITASAATGTGLSNYAIGYVNGSLTVNAAALTITANNDSKTYGTLKTFSGTAFRESGLVNSDTITSVTETSNGAGLAATVGSYPIIASAATGTGLSNYTISYQPGTLLVTPASLVIKANNANKMYGSPLPALSASYTGFVNGDGPASLSTRPTISTTATASSPVLPGGYAIMASGASDPDYTITYQTGSLLVTPASLTITANNTSMYQGEAVPPLSVTFSGFVNGDSPASLVRQPTVTTSATALSSVGAYPIVPGGASSPNYAISYVDGVLAIAPAPVPTVTQAFVLWTQQHNKKGKPVGRRILTGFEFIYNIAPTSADYQIGAYVIERLGRKHEQVLEQVSCSVQTAGTMVKLILNGKQTFADGGLITGTCGSYMISKNAIGISFI